ncbi:hypothetical protein L218DRAFT_642544 [Marasmius fiardii PR-910]|nr:hypothetical protein L218DRAFT_642544 [Marasmius fiardii PR-910]
MLDRAYVYMRIDSLLFDWNLTLATQIMSSFRSSHSTSCLSSQRPQNGGNVKMEVVYFQRSPVVCTPRNSRLLPKFHRHLLMLRVTRRDTRINQLPQVISPWFR